MSKPWPMVPLGELLRLERRPIKVVADGQYAEIGIYCFGRGIFHKTPRSGLEVGNKDLFLVKEGDFILQVTFAWEGAVGLASPAEDGMYGSTRFPTFRVDESRCFPPYLVQYFKTHGGREQLVKISPGSAGRNRVLSLKRIPEVLVPLPPLSEQKRMVVQIEELAAKTEEAQGLRQKAVEEAESLILSSLLHFNSHAHWERKRISDCSEMSTGTTPPSERADYFGGPLQWYTPGDLNHQRHLGRSTRTLSEAAVRDGKARLFSAGTVLLVAIGGSLGKVGIAHERCSANQQITGIKFNAEIQPAYGFWWMRRLSKDLMAAAPQATLPIINQTRIGQFQIVIPPLPDQSNIVAHFDDLQAKVNSLKRLQAESAVELNAMLPSVLDKAFKGEL